MRVTIKPDSCCCLQKDLTNHQNNHHLALIMLTIILFGCLTRIRMPPIYSFLLLPPHLYITHSPVPLTSPSHPLISLSSILIYTNFL